MRIVYAIPGPMSRTSLGRQEVERRGAMLQGWASPGTAVDIRDAPRGPASIESAYEEYLSVPESAQLVARAEDEGYDAAILGCFGDPGLDALREVTGRMAVVGPGEAAFHLAAMLGERFGIVTVTQGVVNPLRQLAARCGLAGKLAGVAVVDTPVLDLAEDTGKTLRRMGEAGRRLVAERDADAIVLGCMSMAFLDVTADIEADLDIPVVNPAKAALKTAEALVGCGLRHSKRAYPRPAKLDRGTASTLAELHLS
ncbi:MAG: aspartate/glutamate racemase family protein [Carbonactinosporaceae bacterium]